VESVWDKATKIISEKISKQNFDTWIKPVKIVNMEDKCIQLAVPNKFFKDWLLDNYAPMIKNSLRSVVGIEIDVDFILNKEKEKKPQASNQNDYPQNLSTAFVSKSKNISFLTVN
jgi:chromosomal replication initiator protein